MVFLTDDNIIIPDANNIELADFENSLEGTNPETEQHSNGFWDHITLETEEPIMSPIQQNHDEVETMAISDHEEKIIIQTQTHYQDPETTFPGLENNQEMTDLCNGAASYPNSVADSNPNKETDHETQPSKRRKRKSTVWEHFTIQTESAGCRRAYCNQCNRSYAYSKGSKVSGTSHLRRHVEKGSCAALLRSQDNNQSEPSSSKGATNSSKRRYKRASSTPQFVFDQDQCRYDIARMIIMHDYPLQMVEHPGFVSFVQNLQPGFNFNMMTFDTVQGDCIVTYQTEKQSLRKFIQQGMVGRICLSLDVWTSSQGVGYVFVTGHFIDADWKLHRRLLNVVMEAYPDSDTAVSHAVKVCLHNWSLESKLFSITYNDQPLNMSEASFVSLKPHLPSNGQLLVNNCLARTLSSIAKEVLENSHDIIKKIRDSIKYVMTSEPHEEKFRLLKKQLQVPSERNIFLDDPTQWNTTYQMLVAANELKQVFCCFDTYDAEFNKQAPSMEDWKQVETVCTHLKSIYDTAHILATTTNPTSSIFFPEVWRIHEDLSKCITKEDPFVSNLAQMMRENINRYWKSCSLNLAIAVVMDPRYKMKYVQFTFPKIYGEEKAKTCIKMVEDQIHQLFQEYSTMPLPLAPNYAEEFDAFIMKNLKTELDQYLTEPPLLRAPELDVLGWWKQNQMMYPTLSQMARNILSFPVSTVPCDSVFDTNAKEMDQYRCSLRAETVEALICTKDWMQYASMDQH